MSKSWYPPPSKPRQVDGGIKARTARGAIGRTWWSGRFITVLEGMGMGNRLQRGRTYARKGQVISIDIEAGTVHSVVQGSRARPYRVRISLTAFGEPDWSRVQTALADSAWYMAKLLAGEMPPDIEDLFSELGLALFPTSARDLSLDCTCPDSAVPCKHLAATFYLLAERFDEDPFMILTWRGREREDLLANLRAARGADPAAADTADGHGVPLAAQIGSFFQIHGELPVLERHLTPPDSLLAQLPPIAVTLRRRDLVDLLRPAYHSLGPDAGAPDEPGPSDDDGSVRDRDR